MAAKFNFGGQKSKAALKLQTDERQKQNDKFAADTMKNLKEQQQRTLAFRLEQKTVEVCIYEILKQM